jgi:Fe-S-cluster-containing dehydrogenase component
MTVSRRNFLKQVASATTSAGAAGAAGVAGVAAGTAPGTAAALERPPKPMPKDAVGLLYDGTLCIGCKACVKACKDANGMPPDMAPEQERWNEGLWDSPVDLSGKTLNIIKVYRHGTMATKDAETNGYAFSKRQCLHCADPSCVSVCPVSAMTKDPVSGIVSHDSDICIGCRYCVMSCPFGVPKYDYANPFGKIAKCQLCKHRLVKNELPGCADVCPTGATLFGRTEDLKAEANRRLNARPGDRMEVARGDIKGQVGGWRPGHERTVAVTYQPRIYGERELGGTQCLAVSGVPFDKLNLPTDVPDTGYPTVTEGIQHTLYHGMMAPAALFAGLIYLAHRNAKETEED